jgi:sugar transferase (PEP-CTERM system associated)
MRAYEEGIMIHVFNHYVPARLIVLAALEALVLMIAAYAGISLHLGTSGAVIAGSTDTIASQAGGFAVGMLILMSSMGLYQPDLWGNKQAIAARLAGAFLLGFVITGLVGYMVPSVNAGPATIAGILIVAFAGSILVRTAFYKWSNLAAFKSRVLVLGTGSRAVKLGEYAAHSASYEVVGYVALQPSTHYISQQHILPMDPDESLLSIVEKHAIDQIVVAVRDRRSDGFPVNQLLECKMKGVDVVELPTFFEREHRQVLLESLNPSWMVLGRGFRQGNVGAAVKRLFDLTVSTALLLLTLPVMMVAALCIYLESGAPVLFRQQRVGQGGRIFTLYKFRSMRKNAEGGGTPQWADVNDERLTLVGRLIRKWRIDELPQIFNVFKGEMSFVGPRPERPFFVNQLVKQIPFYALRHYAKPGITGWAQIRYPYGASIDDAIEKLQYDLYYVKNHSLFLDTMILISTVEVVVWGKGAR